MITRESIELSELARCMPTPARASAPWVEFVRFKVLPATSTKGTRVVVEAYDGGGRRTHRFVVPWRYDIEYGDHCEAIARMLLDSVRGRFEIDDWRYYF